MGLSVVLGLSLSLLFFLRSFYFYDVVNSVSRFCCTLFIYLFLVYNILNNLPFHQKKRNLIGTIFNIFTRLFLNLHPFLSENVPFSLCSVYFVVVVVVLALKMVMSPSHGNGRLFNIHYFVFCGFQVILKFAFLCF